MELHSASKYSESSPIDLNRSTVKSETYVRRGNQEERTSHHLTYEDFKEYRRRCANPEALLPRDHHFYNLAVTELHNRNDDTNPDNHKVDPLEAEDQRLLQKLMTTSKQLKTP